MVVNQSNKSKSENSIKLRQLFSQPQWKEIPVQNGISKWSMKPLLDDSKPQKEAARAASKHAGIEHPVLPYFDQDPPDPKAFYFHAQLHYSLTETLGYELRFVAFANYDTLQAYSIWVSAVPQRFDGNNWINMPDQKEFIYSVNDSPEKIKEEMEQYFQLKGLLKPGNVS